MRQAVIYDRVVWGDTLIKWSLGQTKRRKQGRQWLRERNILEKRVGPARAVTW